MVKTIIAGAVSGFLSAFVVDLNAWSKSDGKAFDWALAVKRWIAGAVAGVTAMFGVNGIGGLE